MSHVITSAAGLGRHIPSPARIYAAARTTSLVVAGEYQYLDGECHA
jgi:hypothetical protein